MTNTRICSKCFNECPLTLEYFHSRGNGKLYTKCRICRNDEFKAQKDIPIEIGSKFGRWEIIDTNKIYKRIGKRNKLVIRCRCECGVIKIVLKESLVCGQSNSCGCATTDATSLPDGQAAKNRVINGIRGGAKRRGLEVTLTDEQIEQLLLADCHYCGSSPLTKSKPSGPRRRNTGNFVRNGIDRMDNKFGYTLNNVVTCCIICNRAKHSMDLSLFLEWVHRLVAYQNKRNID